jgi:hypothetical protein
MNSIVRSRQVQTAPGHGSRKFDISRKRHKSCPPHNKHLHHHDNANRIKRRKLLFTKNEHVGCDSDHTIFWKVTKERPCFGLIEGVSFVSPTLYNRYREMNRKQYLPHMGRLWEIHGIALTGTWIATVNRPLAQPTTAGDSTILRIRHVSLAHMKLLPRHGQPPGIHIARIQPRWQRISTLETQGVLTDDDDTSDTCIGSLSIVSFEGFFSLSECNEKSNVLVKHVLQHAWEKMQSCDQLVASKAVEEGKDSLKHECTANGCTLAIRAQALESSGIEMLVAVDEATGMTVGMDGECTVCTILI